MFRTFSLSDVVCVVVLLSILPHLAIASVVEGDAAISQGFWPGTDMLMLTKSVPDGEGLFAISIAPVDSNTFQFSYAGIAEEYALFSVALGLEFTPSYVSQHTPIISTNGVGPGITNIDFPFLGSRYFAYWDDRNFDSVADCFDNYGWMRITETRVFSDTGDITYKLVASKSATAIGGGIVVGSTIQIPEPNSILLLMLSGLTLLRRGRT